MKEGRKCCSRNIVNNVKNSRFLGCSREDRASECLELIFSGALADACPAREAHRYFWPLNA